MDVLEYNAQRFILVHRRTMPIMIGATLFGAGLVLFGFFKINPAYPILGIPLFIGGLAMLFMSAPQSYVTFDKESGKMEIQRRWVYFKKQLTQVPLSDVTDVRTVHNEKNASQFKVEVKAKDTWLPFTNMWLKDEYNRTHLEGKVRAFLKG
ncbi:MAG: hypothetical protein AB8F95_22360 [Bacteroidia bacterium]